jgi:hypothetical protein
MSIPLQWLSGLPSRDYLIPGWTLLAVIGLGHAAASLLSALGYRQYARAAVLQGGLLVLYIAVEAWAIGLQVMLQPLYSMLGLVQIALGIFAQRKLEASCGGAPGGATRERVFLHDASLRVLEPFSQIACCRSVSRRLYDNKGIHQTAYKGRPCRRSACHAGAVPQHGKE